MFLISHVKCFLLRKRIGKFFFKTLKVIINEIIQQKQTLHENMSMFVYNLIRLKNTTV